MIRTASSCPNSGTLFSSACATNAISLTSSLCRITEYGGRNSVTLFSACFGSLVVTRRL